MFYFTMKTINERERKSQERGRDRGNHLKLTFESLKFILRFYTPNFEEVDGTYWFQVVSPRVHPCVHPFVKNHACFDISYMDSSWKNI